MKRRRVKITGIGFVTPAGIGKEAFWQGILEPVSRVTAVKRFPEEAGAFVAAEVKGFRLDDYIQGINAKRMPRHTQLALAAAAMAAADAGMSLPGLRERNALVMIGATLMDFGVINKGVELILRKGPISALPTSVADGLAASSPSMRCTAGSFGSAVSRPPISIGALKRALR